jgi:hypothetical protein
MKPGIYLYLHLALSCIASGISAADPCRIEVVDRENGWPVPLVELRTNHQVSFYTDNAGVVAFDLPELMGVETWFTVNADGYEVKPDGFGSRGFRFVPESGGSHRVMVDRTMVAKRLGRLTGAGIFAESQAFGDHLDWKESGILGSDSIQSAVHRGRLFWAWGDTTVPKYPLGLFHMTSATTPAVPLASCEPPLKLALDYFRDGEGLVRHVANVAPNDPGPTWIGGYVSLPAADGEPRLVGHYAKIEPPLASYRTGLCVWNDERGNFESVKVLWDKKRDGGKEPASPVGHPVFWNDAEGKEWLLFGNPLPTMRMAATYEAWLDPGQWEILKPQEKIPSRDGGEVKPHSGSVSWNEYRKKWVTVFVEYFGKPSPLGEVWYAEADLPTGPWGRAVKVLSHQDYTFYNPRIHSTLVAPGSPVLLFEGTYTELFSKAKKSTPRHDYNQILYRLDLDEAIFATAGE